MKRNSIQPELYKACVEAFYKALKECPTVREAFDMAYKLPAPRFYILHSTAKNTVPKYMKGGWRPAHAANAEMYEELATRVRERWAKGEKGYACIAEILMEPAPSFYLSRGRFLGIVYDELRRRRKKMKEDRKR
jgi:hypothetical protein